MIRLAITRAAYAAIQETLPESAALQPAEQNLTGKIFVLLDGQTANRLSALREQGEDFSDVILRLATLEKETDQICAVASPNDEIG
jgi:hypothetical protein